MITNSLFAGGRTLRASSSARLLPLSGFSPFASFSISQQRLSLPIKSFSESISFHSISLSSSNQFPSSFARFVSTSPSSKPSSSSSNPNVPHSSSSSSGHSPSHHAKSSRRDQKASRFGLYLFGGVFCCVGLSYAAVPLYRMFCRATGYGGTLDHIAGESAADKLKEAAANPSSRFMTISFTADVASNMNWKFLPIQHSLRIRVGEPALAFFSAKNLRDKPITGVATYNVTPMKSAVYFHKIQCFCFDEQRLRPHEEVDMPVYFFIDPAIEKDKRMDRIDHITLSYTFFPVDDEEEQLTLNAQQAQLTKVPALSATPATK